MHQVTVTQRSIGMSVASIGGVGGYALQDAVTVITTHTGATIRVIGTHSDMSGVDVTPDAPTGDHDAIVAFWKAQAERWAADAAPVSEFDREFALAFGSDIEARAAVRLHLEGEVA